VQKAVVVAAEDVRSELPPQILGDFPLSLCGFSSGCVGGGGGEVLKLVSLEREATDADSACLHAFSSSWSQSSSSKAAFGY
jgi:hypothetical protein